MSDAMPVYIDDGYTQPAYIRGETGLHGAVMFDFRPMTVSERVEYSARFDKLDKAGDQIGIRREMARWIAGKVKEWDVRTLRNSIVEISPSVAIQLPTPVFFKMFGIVSLDIPSDPLPESPLSDGTPHDAVPVDPADLLEADAKN